MSLRWRIKGKLKLIIILLFTISFLFITYQVLYSVTLDEFQSEESAAYLRQHLQKKEIPVRVAQELASDRKDSFLKVPAPFQGGGKPVTGLVLGVAPEYQRYYSKQATKFSCLSSKSRKIIWEKVNDDYCDCPVDGSDEPSTSACMNGRFYCTKSSKSYAGWWGFICPINNILLGFSL